MKIIAAIISFYILLLAIQPALALIDFSSKTECCSHCCGHDREKPAPEKKQQDNSCNNGCNPLMSYNSCIGLAFLVQHFSLAPFITNSEQHSIYVLNAVSEIALPIWQPPKIS